MRLKSRFSDKNTIGVGGDDISIVLRRFHVVSAFYLRLAIPSQKPGSGLFNTKYKSDMWYGAFSFFNRYFRKYRDFSDGP